MDWAFTEEQQDLEGLARRILEDRVTEPRLREIESGSDRYDPDLYAELAKANLLGIALPEGVGGAGLGVIEQCVLLKEVGRTVAPVPLLPSIVLGAMPIAEFGTDEQRDRWARPAVEGETILTAALVEELNPDPFEPVTSAERTGDGWRIRGAKTCVPAGPIADLVLVPASTQEGVGVFGVETGADGVTVERQHVTNKDSEAHIALEGVEVGPDALLGTVEEGSSVLGWIRDRAVLGVCAHQLGVTERAVEFTAQYTKDREQFDRPIANFQAVGQRMADAYIDVEGIRHTLWQAAWKVSEGLPAATDLQTAKFWAADAGHRVAHTAVHIHGGTGVDLDNYVHRYFLAAKHNEFVLGNATEQLRNLGKTLAEEPA